MVELRPHQVIASDDIDQLFAKKFNYVMSVQPTGSGKTIIKAHFAKKAYDNGETCVLIAHRDVLLGQISNALCMFKIPHTLICADKTIRDITNINYKEYGNHYYDVKSRIVIISVATFAARLKKERIPQSFCESVDWWLMDECFVAGTKINTPDGLMNIEHVKVGDTVESFNQDSLKFENKTVTKLYKNPIKHELIKITSRSHHVLICTAGHPILTKQGWKKAYELTTNDEVLDERVSMHDMQQGDHRNNRGETLQVQKGWKNLLQQRMCAKMGECKCRETGTCCSTSSEMPHVRQQCRPDRLSLRRVQEKGSCLLQQRMFSKILFNAVKRNNVKNEQEICFCSNEEKQPNEGQFYSRKNESNIEGNGSQTSFTGWKRATTDRRRNETLRNVKCSRFQATNHRKNGSITGDIQLPCSLQNRLRKQRFKNSNRSRRIIPLFLEKKRARHEKGQGFNWSRLESVEILEQGDSQRIGNGFVYNLEVSDNHTYIANSVVVHNCHHLTQGSQWGTCVESFPNARGLGVTATPLRGDRKGLGKHAHGYFETISCTSSMIELVKEGRLTQMKVYAPTQLDVGDLKATAGGDYNQKKLYEKTKKQGSHITGSAVEYYNKYTYGQPVITFAVNIEHGKYIAKKFNEAGVPTAFVSSKSSESDRKQAVSDLRKGVLWNLVNVDLFGEGFDAPAVSAVFLLRKTQSYSLFKQQIGRCLRPFEGKDFGYVFDHVGNVAFMLDKYNLQTPYHDPDWTLDSYGKGGSGDGGEEIPKSMECPECAYEAPLNDVFDEDGDLILKGFLQPDGSYKCPDEECGHHFDDSESEVVVRKIQEKKGELVELKFDEIDDLIRKRDDEIFKDVSKMDYGPYAGAQMSRHVDRQNAIIILKRKINTWCNNLRFETGWSSELIRREFEVTFKTNIFKAQILSSPKAMELSKNVQKDIIRRSNKKRA